MASRRKGRILAFQSLYFWESAKTSESAKADLEELISFSWIDDQKLEKYRLDGTEVFARLLVTGALENIKEIDNKIKDHLEHWDITRLNRVDLAVLRLSVYSLMYQHEIAPSIIIDEAIGICREFGSDDSFKFVNGVLDSIRKSVIKKNAL